MNLKGSENIAGCIYLNQSQEEDSVRLMGHCDDMFVTEGGTLK